MVYNVKIVVTEIKADFDPFGGEYTQVCFGYRVPIPRPPEADRAYPPAPRQVMYKHAVHIFVPRDQWEGQYTMWAEYDMRLNEDGTFSIQKSPVVSG